MRADDVTDILDLALQASGCDQLHVVHKPPLLRDNGSSYFSGVMAEWLQDKGIASRQIEIEIEVEVRQGKASCVM